MKIKIAIVPMGGCYLKAIFGQNKDPYSGEWTRDAVIGADEEELYARLKTRLPGLKARLKGVSKCAQN